jgi:hypothetical protein
VTAHQRSEITETLNRVYTAESSAMDPAWVHIQLASMGEQQREAARSHLTVCQLRQSGLIGMWKDRDDIRDSAAYARRLREQAQRRGDDVLIRGAQDMPTAPTQYRAANSANFTCDAYFSETKNTPLAGLRRPLSFIVGSCGLRGRGICRKRMEGA